MTSSVEEFRKLLHLIEQHPELREELRRHVLTEELLRLPALVARQEERLTALERLVADLVTAVRDLTAAVRAHDARFDRIDSELADLRRAVQALIALAQRHDERLTHLEEIAARQEALLAQHGDRLARLEEIAARQEALLAQHGDRLARLEEIAARQEALLAQHGDRLARLEEIAARQEALLAQHGDRLAQLEEIAARQEERLGRVEEETRELRQAIQELTEAVKQLARKSAEHDRKLDRFSFLIGVHLEREASVELVRFFEAEGWKLVERPRAIAVNGEFDVVARFMRGEESVWVIIETKARVYPRDITDFASKLQSSQVRSKLAARGLQGTVLAYLAGGNIEQQVDDVCRALGVGLIDVLGIVLHPQPFTLD